MSIILNPYLNFRTEAREALTFWASVLGGEPTVMTFADGGMAAMVDDPQLVMHGQLTTPAGLTLMAADVPAAVELTPGGTVSLSGDDLATLTAYYEGLSAGGTLTVPLAKAPWGDTFGMFSDRFGIAWLVNATA